MKASSLALVFLALGVAAANAQPVCSVFKTFNAAANTGLVQDTIVVPDSFVVGTAQVSNMVIGHPAPDTLVLSLLHKTSPDAAPMTSALKPADTFGVFAPATSANGQAAAGQWVLRIEDTQPGAEQ
jgi:subtilisin-like proprotein convertase family protein